MQTTQKKPYTKYFHFKPVASLSIEKLLKGLNSLKATGPDGIPASMLKDAYKELAATLSHLINVSTKIGVFPTAEKLAKVKPIYKSGERSSFDNYRPISVLNILSKVLEKVVCQQISEYLESNKLINTSMVSERVTQNAVLHIHDHIRQHTDKKSCTGALYIDLRHCKSFLLT